MKDRLFVDIDQAREKFYYCGDTGWLIHKTGRRIGERAGSYHSSDGYRNVRIRSVMYREHRVIWAMIYGYCPLVFLDHINGDRSDNRITNLREATNSQNMQNSVIRKDNKLGVKGVRLTETGTFGARIRINGKRISKEFTSLNEAKQWRLSKELELHSHAKSQNLATLALQ
jgi:hypothetical protein